MKPVGLNMLGKAITLFFFMAFTFIIEYMGLFNGSDNYFYDLFFRLRGPGESSKNIAIIAIDDKTLEKLGRWPIRRLHYASLLSRLKEADAVAFDVIMAEPTDDDNAFEKAVKQYGKAVFPVVIDDRMAITYPVMASARDRTGHIHLEQGIDGVVREVYHTISYRDISLPSFTSITYENATGTSLKRMTHGRSYGQKENITQFDRMVVNYSGGPGTFERLSLSDVLEGLYPPSYFKNRICLVGITATGVSEILLTPFSQERRGTPGVEVHANILSNLLLGNPVHIVPHWVRWPAVISLMFFSFLCFLRMSELMATMAAFAMLLCIATISCLLFSIFNIWLGPSMSLFAVVSVFVMAYAFKFNEAVAKLDKAYMALMPHLRRHDGAERKGRLERGMKGLLTPGGVYSKTQILAGMTEDLVFEKQLTDSAIFSDIQGVLLFGPDRSLVLANNLASGLCRENSLDTASIDVLMHGMANFMPDRIDTDSVLERLYSGDYQATFNVSLPFPEKKYFKIDASSLAVRARRYPLFVLSDITTIKELETLKDHVVSLVSHEIKTPLISIQGFSEMLYDTLEGEMKGYASIVHRESGRLIRFLNMFLDISRIEEGRQPIRLEPVVLSDVMKEVALELSGVAEESGISINTELPEQMSPVMVDRDLVKQCLVNLAENAIKYSPPEKKVILKLIEDVEYVRADIIDHGTGIREEEIELIFEKFYRAHMDSSKNIQGSGLGLTFVREAINAQGGKVSVESRYGEGSKFSVIFPKTQDK